MESLDIEKKYYEPKPGEKPVLVVCRKSVSAIGKTHYVNDDNHSMLCGLTVVSTDIIVSTVTDNRILPITCDKCREHVDDAATKGLVVIARPKKKVVQKATIDGSSLPLPIRKSLYATSGNFAVEMYGNRTWFDSLPAAIEFVEDSLLHTWGGNCKLVWKCWEEGKSRAFDFTVDKILSALQKEENFPHVVIGIVRKDMPEVILGGTALIYTAKGIQKTLPDDGFRIISRTSVPPNPMTSGITNQERHQAFIERMGDQP